jgi:hypothetical protein
MTLSDGTAGGAIEHTARYKVAGPGIINAAAVEGFESASLSTPFEEQLLARETNAITPCLRTYLPPDALILEARSGSGRRVEWLHRERRRRSGWTEAPGSPLSWQATALGLLPSRRPALHSTLQRIGAWRRLPWGDRTRGRGMMGASG